MAESGNRAKKDFVARVILLDSNLTGSEVDPVNVVESHFYLLLSKFSPAFQAVHAEITLRKLKASDAMRFDWWEAFWRKRGIPLLQADEESFAPRASPQPPDGGNNPASASGTLTNSGDRRRVGQPGGPEKSLRIF